MKNTPCATQRERKTAPPQIDESTTAHDLAGEGSDHDPAPRADYERLAESLLTMITLDSDRCPQRLDADLSGGTIH